MVAQWYGNKVLDSQMPQWSSLVINYPQPTTPFDLFTSGYTLNVFPCADENCVSRFISSSIRNAEFILSDIWKELQVNRARGVWASYPESASCWGQGKAVSSLSLLFYWLWGIGLKTAMPDCCLCGPWASQGSGVTEFFTIDIIPRGSFQWRVLKACLKLLT